MCQGFCAQDNRYPVGLHERRKHAKTTMVCVVMPRVGSTTYIYIYIYTHTYIFTYIYTHVYIYIYIYTSISLSINIYIYIYIYIYIFIYTYSSWQRQDQLRLESAPDAKRQVGGSALCGRAAAGWRLRVHVRAAQRDGRRAPVSC